MPEIPDPSKQPSNPFFEKQGSQPSITPKVDIGPAKIAFESLMGVFDDAIEKTFKKHEKFLKSLTNGEEEYWKISTKYANSYSGLLDKQHDEKLRAIRQERDAEIEKAKKTEDGIKNLNAIKERYRKQEEGVFKETESKRSALSLAEQLHGGVTKAVGIAIPGAGVALDTLGTLVTESATGVGLFVAALEVAAKTTLFLSERQAELGRSSASLIGAGAGLGTTGADVERRREALFGGRFAGIVGVGEGRKALGTLGEAPSLLGQATRHVGDFQNTLSAFGNIMPDVNEEVMMFSKGSRDLGLDLKGLNNVYGISRRSAQLMGGSLEDWNTNQKDTIDMYLGLQKSFRGFTTDANAAAGALLGLSPALQKLFPGAEERKQAVQTIGEGIGGQSFTTLSGLFALTHGGQLPPEKDPFAKGGSLNNANKVVNDAVKFIMAQSGATDNFTKNALQQGLMTQLNMNLPARIVPHFTELLEGAATPLSPKQKARADELAREAMAHGTDKLVESQGFLTVATNHLTNAITHSVLNDPNAGRNALNAAGSIVPPEFMLIKTLVDSGMNVSTAKNGARHNTTGKQTPATPMK